MTDFPSSRCTPALLLAVALATPIARCPAAITIQQISGTNWKIGNGDLNVVFNPAANKLTSVAIGASGNLLDPGNSQLYPEFAGTPFGSGTQSSGFQQTSNFIDFWTTTASTGTSTNPLTYSFHYVLFNNDPNIVVYQVLNHSATDPATSVGQGQFLARVNPSLFFNTYQVNVGPNNPGPQTSKVPAYTDSTGRDVQDATVDIAGEGSDGRLGEPLLHQVRLLVLHAISASDDRVWFAIRRVGAVHIARFDDRRPDQAEPAVHEQHFDD